MGQFVRLPEPEPLNWASPGVRLKPPGCQACPLAAKHTGFCADWVPKDPKVFFLCDQPGPDDVLEQRPWSGAQGAAWWQRYVRDLGYKREDVAISHVLRCSGPAEPTKDRMRPGGPKYPASYLKRNGEANCRGYDNMHVDALHGTVVEGGLVDWKPDVFLLTFHPRDVYKVAAYHRQILRDVEKAFAFAGKGHKPVVLFGQGACEFYFPMMIDNGGLKSWRGHWFEGSYPWQYKANANLKSFKRAATPVWGRRR